MSLSAHIKQSAVLDGNTAMVDAVITHSGRGAVDGEQARFALQAAVNNDLVPIAGSMRVLEVSPYRTTVRAAMMAASEVVPYQEGMAGFTSVSSNIYMDEKEGIWSLRQSESGQVLIRSNAIDDASEIGELLESCSNVNAGTAFSRDQQYFQAVASANTRHGVDRITPQDFVTFAHAGEVHNGFIVTAHVDENGAPMGTFTAVAFSDNPDQQPVTIKADAVIHNHGVPAYVEPEGMQVSVSSANDLVSYYRKIYGHNVEFFRELEKRIRGYALA